MRILRTGRRETALTLIEIMVVVMIMGLIAAVVSKVVVDKLETGRVEVSKTQIAELRDAVEMFYLQNSFYPTTDQGLQALVTKPTSGKVPDTYPEKGYIQSVPLDPWKHEYVYICPGTRADFEIMCLGRDGAEGGTGFDADINSWELGGVRGAKP